MLELFGVLLLAVISVMVVRSWNSRRNAREDGDEDLDAPPTWEDAEDLRYGATEEEDWSAGEETWGRDADSWGDDDAGGAPPQHIPELDDPDRR